MLVIETNISYNEETKEQEDHQSRVINVESWQEYVDTYLFEWSTWYDGSIGGYNFRDNSTITDLKYDEFHLSCTIDSGKFKTVKLAYKLQDELSLEHNVGGNTYEDCKSRN